MDRVRRIPFLLVALVLAMTVAAAPSLAVSVPAGAQAYACTEQLAVASRIAGTQSELEAARTIAGWFEDAGYETGMQPFTYGSGKKMRRSQNVIASLPSTSGNQDAPLVIVGAHYDSVAAGNGADDNASGVGCMVEIAREVATYDDRDYDIEFVAFGAEEVGLEGSFFYADQMSDDDIARTHAMINFDSLIVGDMLYIHAGFNELTGPRDAMLAIIEDLSLPIGVQPGLNEHYPSGLTPDWFSDYTAFNQAGIPIVAFESTNWEIGDLDGYVETAKFGSFWHTGKDKLKTIEQRFPGRPIERLAAYTTLVETYLEDPAP